MASDWMQMSHHLILFMSNLYHMQKFLGEPMPRFGKSANFGISVFSY